LIKAVPQLKDVADLTGEQVANIGSQTMNHDVWLKLAKRVNDELSPQKGPDPSNARADEHKRPGQASTSIYAVLIHEKVLNWEATKKPGSTIKD